MKPMIAAAIAAFMSAPLAGHAALAQDASPDAEQTDLEGAELTEGEVKLQKILGDRVAHASEPCLPTYGLRNMKIIHGTALVFDYGGTIYVNVPAGAERLRKRDRLVTTRSFARLCSSDIVRTEDRYGGHYTGNVILSRFVPYKRVPANDAG